MERIESMIIREGEYNSPYLERLSGGSWKNAVFYDIETTGLGWRSSHLYLIGALYHMDGRWLLRQWFLDRPFAEKDMLECFAAFLHERDSVLLTDYNGSTFDLPYLRSKYSYYGMPLPSALSDQENSEQCHMDLLRILRPLKSKLPLSSLKLQEVEHLLCTDRKDEYSGKDLIEVYYRFLQSGDHSFLDLLFRHNYEDTAALPAVVSLLSFSDFWDGRFVISKCRENQDSFCFQLLPATPFPVVFDLKGYLKSTISFQHSCALLTLPVFSGERKLFFPDPKHYFFLPDEDQAIHKSVGVFTDPAHRMQASASNCYQRISGRYLPVPSVPAISEVHHFYEKYRDKTAWLRTEELLSCGPDVQYSYILSVLSGFFTQANIKTEPDHSGSV